MRRSMSPARAPPSCCIPQSAISPAETSGYLTRAQPPTRVLTYSVVCIRVQPRRAVGRWDQPHRSTMAARSAHVIATPSIGTVACQTNASIPSQAEAGSAGCTPACRTVVACGQSLALRQVEAGGRQVRLRLRSVGRIGVHGRSGASNRSQQHTVAPQLIAAAAAAPLQWTAHMHCWSISMCASIGPDRLNCPLRRNEPWSVCFARASRLGGIFSPVAMLSVARRLSRGMRRSRRGTISSL